MAMDRLNSLKKRITGVSSFGLVSGVWLESSDSSNDLHAKLESS